MPRKTAKRGKQKKMQQGGLYDDSDSYVDSGDIDQEDYQSSGPIPDDLLDEDDRMMGMGSEGYADSGGGTSGQGYADATTLNNNSLAPFKALQQRQTDSLQMLKDAQARAVAALNPKPDRSAMWMAIAQGLLSPTKTGGFSESLGNAAGGAAPYMQHYADADTANKATIANMDYGLAQSLYKDATKNPQIIDWYAKNPGGAVGKQKALVIDGQPVPFGEIFTPQGSKGGNSFLDKINWYAHASPEERAMYDKILAPKANQSVVNVQSSVPFETESQKKAADRLDALFADADKSRGLATQLNATAPYIDKTPDAYFGPAGPGLVTIGKALKQSGLYDAGEGLDNAGFVDSIMNHLGPAQRIVGSGSSSDRDVAMFMNSLPGLSQTKAGNKMLIKYYNKLNDYNQKLVRIIRQYAKTHQDFYGIEDLPTEEINKAGRVFSDADLQEMSGASTSPRKKTSIPHANVDEDEETITISPGSN